VVEALHLKDGDQIEITVAGERGFEVTRDKNVERALARRRKLRESSPPLLRGFRFDRDEANAR
jgi:antitoxin MazE